MTGRIRRKTTTEGAPAEMRSGLHPIRDNQTMTFTEAAAEVLRMAGKPLHYKEITELAIEKNLLSHVGKSPEVTMGARLAALLKKEDKENPIIRVKPGVFGLREWDGKKKKRGGCADEGAAESDEGL